jgi:hypothetical protein
MRCVIGKVRTVIGTIGKTHGVKSESAPTDIASQMKDHNEPFPAGPLRGFKVARSVPVTVGALPALAEFDEFGRLSCKSLVVEDVSELTVVVAGAAFGLSLLAFVNGPPDGDGLEATIPLCGFGVADGDDVVAKPVLATNSISALNLAVLGGRHVASLQV